MAEWWQSKLRSSESLDAWYVLTVTRLKHITSRAFYNRREEEELGSNVKLFELLVLTIKADRRD